jgi:hypothetical protein
MLKRIRRLGWHAALVQQFRCDKLPQGALQPRLVYLGDSM